MISTSVTCWTDAFASEPPSATVVKVTGEIQIAGKVARAGDTLREDDEIVVSKGENDAVDLKLAEGHQVRLKKGTHLKLGAVKNGQRLLELIKGQTFVRFNKSAEAKGLDVRTKAVVAGVRGTKFSVSIDEVMGTYVCVCEGSVEVQKPEGGPTKTVKAGQDIWARSEKPLGKPLNSPGMSQMTAQEIATMKY
jgi:ferric-dicitrate binding protein FerR (iron transport regulator)